MTKIISNVNVTITKQISMKDFLDDMRRVNEWYQKKKLCQEDHHQKGNKQAQDTLYRLGRKYGMTVEEIVNYAKQYN